MELIDQKQYFVETEKAMQIALENEKKLHTQIPTREKLRIVEAELKQAKTREDHEQLKELKKDLELRIQLKELNQAIIPEEHRKKIRRNKEIEDQEVIEKLNELKKELSSTIAKIEEELIPVVRNIAALEERRTIGKKLDIIIEGHIHESPQLLSSMYFMRGVSLSSDGYNSIRAKKLLFDTVQVLKRIEVPIESKGIFKKFKKVGTK